MGNVQEGVVQWGNVWGGGGGSCPREMSDGEVDPRTIRHLKSHVSRMSYCFKSICNGTHV